MNPNLVRYFLKTSLDRYFKKMDGNWGMVHIGCIDKAPREKCDEVLRDAVREKGGCDIKMDAPLGIGYPVVACSLCGKTGQLGTWRENRWKEE